MSGWPIYFYFIAIFVIIRISDQQRRKRLKPRVLLEPSQFLRILDQYDSKIIKTGKQLLQGYMYVIEGDDYYYYAISKEAIELPPDREVIHSRSVQF